MSGLYGGWLRIAVRTNSNDLLSSEQCRTVVNQSCRSSLNVLIHFLTFLAFITPSPHVETSYRLISFTRFPWAVEKQITPRTAHGQDQITGVADSTRLFPTALTWRISETLIPSSNTNYTHSTQEILNYYAVQPTLEQRCPLSGERFIFWTY